MNRTAELLIRPCLAHAASPDTDARELLVEVRDCPDCLVTHPSTGEWVPCRSNAAPA